MLNISLSALIESLLLPIMVVLVGLYFNTEDPLFLHAHFPWVWLIPVLIALRYGLLSSALGVGVYLLTMFFTIHHHFFEWASYQNWLLGGLCLTLICCEYHAHWRFKQYKLDQKSAYLDTRLESLSRAYSTMRISHDRLEEALIMKPVTLRGALTDLRYYIAKHKGQLDDISSPQLMAILANCAHIGRAGLYLMKDKHISTTAVASLGEPLPLDLQDTLVKRALKDRETIYVAVNSLLELQTSQYQAVIPMQTADDQTLGLLAITELPFLSMTEESLKILSLLLAYVADDLYAAKAASAITEVIPDCPPFFASEIFKLQHVYRITGQDSTLFFYYFPKDERGTLQRKQLRQEARGLDVTWERESHDELVLILLMPLTHSAMLDSYLNRINHQFMKNTHQTLDEAMIRHQHFSLSHFKTTQSLIEVLASNDIT